MSEGQVRWSGQSKVRYDGRTGSLRRGGRKVKQGVIGPTSVLPRSRLFSLSEGVEGVKRYQMQAAW
jgi:hypothetical protein